MSDDKRGAMYRIATLNDMVRLVAWKRRAGGEVPPPWGLKRFGTLLCERHIEQHTPLTVLEAGVGFTSHFHDFTRPSVDYWTVDQPGFYDTEQFARGVAARHSATHVDGLVGDFLPELPSAHFELTLSISALEHSDPTRAPDICSDLYRITAPSGYAVHTIDTPLHRPEFRLKPWYDAFLAAGFRFTEDPDLAAGSRVAGGLAALFEPLDVHVSYYKNQPGWWDDPHLLRDHQGTIIVIARRPD